MQKSYVYLLGGLSFMCFSAICIKAADAPGMVTVFYRMGLAAMVLTVPYIVFTIKAKQYISKRGALLAILAGSVFGFDMLCWSKGISHSNATIPTLVANLAPVWVGLASIPLFKEKHRTAFWIGLTIALTGIFVMVNKDLEAGNGFVKGVVFGIFAGLFYAAFYLLSQEGRKQVSAFSFLYISTLTSAIIIGIFVWQQGYALVGYNQKTWLIFLFKGLGIQVIGWYLITKAQGMLPASIIAPILLAQPVLTYVWAVLLLKEQLTSWQIVGGAIVVAGIYLVHFSKRKI